MELLGDNLSELRRKTATGKFSMATTLSLGIIFVRSLEQIHDLGYLHRDVKPSNFVIGNDGRRNQVFVIDFGLARKFVMPDGSIRPARDQAGFRGTARYASINSHMSRDLGRRDDLWSVLYILIEFAKGFLPWRKLKEKDEIRDVKINMNTPELCDELPKEFLQFMDHLQALDYADRPDYDYLIQLLQHRLKLMGCDEQTPFDWETNTTPAATNPYTSISPSNDHYRPDSAGRPVVSNEVGPADDPENPVIYKLVAGGRRAQRTSASNAGLDMDADEHGANGRGGTQDEDMGNFASGPARHFTDSAEEGRRGADDGSMMGGEDDDDMSNESEKPKPASKAAPASTPKDSPRRHSVEVGGKDQQELDVMNKGNQPTRGRPAPHSSEKCKCTIL